MSGAADPTRVVPVLEKAFEASEVRVTAKLRSATPDKTVERKSGKAASPRAIRKAKAAA